MAETKLFVGLMKIMAVILLYLKFGRPKFSPILRNNHYCWKWCHDLGGPRGAERGWVWGIWNFGVHLCRNSGKTGNILISVTMYGILPTVKCGLWVTTNVKRDTLMVLIPWSKLVFSLWKKYWYLDNLPYLPYRTIQYHFPTNSCTDYGASCT